MRRRTVVCGMLLASATVVFVAACSREEVRVERETTTQMAPSTPTIKPAPAGMVRQSPPPPREEFQTPPPSPGHAWIPGYWTWERNTWVWIAGRWERPPERMVTWVPGQWFQRGDTWMWREGHWQ